MINDYALVNKRELARHLSYFSTERITGSSSRKKGKKFAIVHLEEVEGEEEFIEGVSSRREGFCRVSLVDERSRSVTRKEDAR